MKSNVSCVWLAVGMSLGATPALLADQTFAAANPAEKSYTGTIVSVDSQTRILDTKSMLLSKQFKLGENCAFLLPDNLPGDLNSLRPGEKIQVNYLESNGVRAADRVVLVPMRYEGMVKAIDPMNHTLALRLRMSDENLVIEDKCRILLRNNQPGSLNSIQPGNWVTVTYETPGDRPTAWQIEQTSQSFTGSLVAFDLTDHTLKAREGLSSKEFTLGDHCAVVLNGRPDGRLEDLRPDERLVFNYDEVNGVNVVNRIAPAAPESAGNPTMTSAPDMGY